VNPSKLMIILVALGLLAGVGVTVALASSPAHPSALMSTATSTTCTGEDEQGQDEDNQGQDEEAEAASEIAQAADEVEQEATRARADDQDGDDQPGDQGENDDCDD
jgi:hypothetical protein